MGQVSFYKIDNTESVVHYLYKLISSRLDEGKKVLWLVAGGSAVELAAKTSQKLSGANLSRLSVTLTDERFVPVGHEDSNWQQLLNAGFKLSEDSLNPVLSNNDIDSTTRSYGLLLEELINATDYRIGLFGMGPDGHIAALFPGFPQLKEKNFYAVYFNDSPKPPPLRITMTIPAILKLDEAVIFAKGEEKRTMLENLSKDLAPTEQPAQLLKQIPKLTIFNDHKGEEL